MSAYIPLLQDIFLIVIAYIIFHIVLSVLLRFWFRKKRTKRITSNIKILTQVVSYIFFIGLTLTVLSTHTGFWNQLGISIGLLSAALGWALQRPITGVAAWIMIVIRRPFDIGDRIIVNGIRGDVADISLTHIRIKEIGGIVAGEENSGRTVLVPNSILFEQNIVNYTYASNTNILDQIEFIITFDSDLEKTKQIAIEEASNVLEHVLGKHENNPYTLVYFDHSGMKVLVRYFAPANNLQEFSSSISQQIFYRLQKEKDVRLAHPHHEVIVRQGETSPLY